MSYPVLLASSALAIVLVLALAREIRCVGHCSGCWLDFWSFGGNSMRKTRRDLRPILPMSMIQALSILLVAGCSDERDQRLAEMAERHVAEQARQNERLAQ